MTTAAACRPACLRSSESASDAQAANRTHTHAQEPVTHRSIEHSLQSERRERRSERGESEKSISQQTEQAARLPMRLCVCVCVWCVGVREETLTLVSIAS